MIDSAETHALLQKARDGSRDACERLIQENGGLIWSVVRRYIGRGVETDDLYQLGAMGLLKAIYGFDPHYGTQFSTYAVPKIAGEIRRFLRDDGPVKVSRAVKERAANVYSVRIRLSHALGREPTLLEVSQDTGWSLEDLAAVDLATASPASLQAEAGAHGAALQDLLGGGEMEEAILERMTLQNAIAALPERERQTVYLRFFKGFTQARAAKVLHVSQVQISRLERRAVARLREILSA